jgi:Bax protein
MTTSTQKPTRFQRNLFIVICLFSMLFLGLWYHFLRTERGYDNTSPPDFAAISDTDSRKQSFIEFLYPLIAAENHKILQQRAKLIAIKQQLRKTSHITTDQAFWLERLAGYYAVAYDATDKQAAIELLLRRVNVIPPSLALAQAANETAWGVSRFAIEANNYFGQWCYREGCGLVPLSRDEGLSHEVKSFNSAADSVKSYLNILNSAGAYTYLRTLRQQLENQKRPLTGFELAAGLSKYSERGAAYVSSIRSLIEANNLQDYTDDFNLSSGGSQSELAF